MKKAWAYRKAKKKVICTACVRYCQIYPNTTGFCQTRINVGHSLYSLIYGLIQGFQVDPIEKKPFYHFYPGTPVLSFGSYGCNFRCRQCLNSWCSYGDQASRILNTLKTEPKKKEKLTSPQAVIDLCRKEKCPGIAFTYNEPSIWPEFVYDTAKLAKKAKLYTCFVTNGSWAKESLAKLAPVIDAANIDIKGFFPETYRKMDAYFPSVLTNTELVLKKYKIHLELTTLVIPTVNDSERELTAIARFIKSNLGPFVPWHLSRFDPKLAPDRKFQKLPTTSHATLERAYRIGRKEGLEFVYVWAPPKNINEPLFAISRTVCPQCGQTAIDRDAWQVKEIKADKQGRCLNCGRDLYLKTRR